MLCFRDYYQSVSLYITVATRMTTYVGAPQPFNASDDKWTLYIQHFKHFLLPNKIDSDEEKCHLLLALMRAPTHKLVEPVCTKKPSELKFKDICNTLKRHFSPQPIKIAEHYRFYNRKVNLRLIIWPNFGNWQARFSLVHFLTKPSMTD